MSHEAIHDAGSKREPLGGPSREKLADAFLESLLNRGDPLERHLGFAQKLPEGSQTFLGIGSLDSRNHRLMRRLPTRLYNHLL